MDEMGEMGETIFFFLFVYFELNVNETVLMDIYDDDAALGVIIVIFIV